MATAAHPPWSPSYTYLRRMFYEGKLSPAQLMTCVSRGWIKQEEADGIVSDFLADPQVAVGSPTPIPATP